MGYGFLCLLIMRELFQGLGSFSLLFSSGLSVQKGFSHCVLDERKMGSNSWMMSEMGFLF